MKLRNHLFTLWLLSAALLFTTSCEKDDPETTNEQEVITTVTLTLIDDSGNPLVVLTWRDLDGEGGDDPVITQDAKLTANTMYYGSISILNELESPAEVVTAEIKEEDKEHQFFFSSTVAGITFSYNDKDGDDLPVGLESILSTGAAGSGMINIVLKHEPNKTASGVSDGDITNAGGETDFDITFPIEVE